MLAADSPHDDEASSSFVSLCSWPVAGLQAVVNFGVNGGPFEITILCLALPMSVPFDDDRLTQTACDGSSYV